MLPAEKAHRHAIRQVSVSFLKCCMNRLQHRVFRKVTLVCYPGSEITASACCLIKRQEPFHCWHLKGRVLESSPTLHAPNIPNHSSRNQIRPLFIQKVQIIVWRQVIFCILLSGAAKYVSTGSFCEICCYCEVIQIYGIGIRGRVCLICLIRPEF
jgi:hypothetical protein